MLRLIDYSDLNKYHNTTPVAYDQYLDYADMQGANNSAFGGFNLIADPNMHPRGSFAIDSIRSVAGAALPLNGTDAYVDFTVTEPLLLSPFILSSSNPSNGSGLWGVQNMSFNFNMGYPNRVFRHTDLAIAGQSITGVSIESITNSSLKFFFLSAHPSDVLSSRSVVPFYELPRYINSAQTVAVATGDGLLGVNFTPGKSTLTSSTISLNQIPDKFIIFSQN